MGAELLLLGGKVSAGGAAGSGAVAASSAGAGRCVAGGRRLAPVQPAALQWRHSSTTIEGRTSTDQKPPLQRCAAAELWRGDAEDGKMGFEKEILKAGTGPKPVKGQKVTVHCTGYGKDGDLSKKFWSTKDPGQQPFSFNIGLGSVIKGWDEGVMGMQLGEVARLTCTPDYAYGEGGFPAWGIQPNSVLIFEIEVLSAK
ncbi:unnamed protein product [Triticum turgidum subsp. durum]|uniref:peptidylprolyl isomerase n=1 Tax=Triticum turgidum subsp. durum TaxID=4567 RepID=A0A9R0Y7G5_TRITD|nr:unnamed protein product [Triticum turgidum subsp. durum]